MDFDKHREEACGIDSNYKQYFKNFDFISFIYWSMRRVFNLTAKLCTFPALISLLKIIPGISYALIYFDLMHDIIMNTITSKRSLHTKIFKTTITLLTSFIVALSFVFSSNLIKIAGSAINIVSSLWDCSTIIASKLFGKLKECRDLNIQIKANLTLAESAHKIIINTVFIIGAALMLNPVTFVTGAIVLIAVTAYAVIDRFKINPLRWLANQLFNFPFKKIKQNHADIKKQFNDSTLKLQSGLKTKKIKRTSFKITTAHTFKHYQPAVYKNDRFFSSAIQQRLGEKSISPRHASEGWHPGT